MPVYSTCVFCLRNDSQPSREHILATWIAAEFPEPGWIVENVDTKLEYTTYNNLGIVNKKPCRRCNNEWMNDLEIAARPVLRSLIKGIPTTLTAQQQRAIVRWFLKTAMMFDLHAENKRPCYFEAKERHALMTSLSIVSDAMVFTGQYCGSTPVMVYSKILPFLLTRKNPNVTNRKCEIKGHTATIAIGQLVLQLFCFRRPKEFALDSLELAAPGNPNDWDNGCVKVWPSDGDVDWPPPRVLDDEGFDLFMKRWASLLPPPRF